MEIDLDEDDVSTEDHLGTGYGYETSLGQVDEKMTFMGRDANHTLTYSVPKQANLAFRL